MTAKHPLPNRFIEDVHEGQELPPLVKRPTTLTLFRYSAATVNPHKIHYDAAYAREEGHPDVLVHGPLQGAYLAQLVTDWMGPQGVLRRFGWSNRRSATPSNVLTCRGRVTKVYRAGGEHRVDLEIQLVNEHDEICAPGTATVALPARTPLDAGV